MERETRTEDIGLGAEGRAADEGGIDVGKDAIGGGVGLHVLTEPLLGEGHGEGQEV